jgi:hypothetical protein
MGMYGGGSAPAPVTNNYEESFREALQAQVDLAPDLFRAEANQTYGRPAYARMEQDLIKEALFGNEIRYDEEGRQITGYMDAKDSFSISDNLAEVNAKKQEAAKAFKVPIMGGVLGAGTGFFGTSMRKTLNLPDPSKVLAIPKEKFTVTGANGVEKVFSSRNEAENWINDQQGKAIYKKDASGNVIYNKDKANTVEGGTGAIGLVAGNQITQFYDGQFRKAGFDTEGNFLGTSQLEQDMLERAKYGQTQTEIGLANEFGQQLTDAYRKQGGIQEALDSYNALGRETSDHGGLRSSLVGMAVDELAAGGGLTDRERRRVEQSSRSAMSARGRGRDFAGVVDEVAANETLSRQRESERRLFASQVLGLADSGLAQDRAFAAQRVGLEQATSADPFLAITGRTSGATVASGQSLYGNAAAGINAGPALFNPAQGAEFMANQSAMINDYNANIYAADQAKAGAMFGAVAGLAGSLGGAAIKRCWVAREVYGANNPKWLIFRNWLDVLSPFWFRAIYLTFGERFAKFISDKPRLKARIRAWMDTKIRETV